MPPIYNGNTPDVYGLEWVAHRSGLQVLDPTRTFLQRIHSTVTENIVGVRVPVPSEHCHGGIIVEAIVANQGEGYNPADITYTRIRPSLVVDFSSGVTNQAGAAPTAAQVQSTTLNTATFWRMHHEDPPHFIESVNTQLNVGGIFSGRRILGVRAGVVAQHSGGGTHLYFSVALPGDPTYPFGLTNGLIGRIHPQPNAVGTTGLVERHGLWGEWFSDFLWSPQVLANLGGTANLRVESINTGTGQTPQTRIYQLWLEVAHVPEHGRQGFGATYVPPGTPAGTWQQLNIFDFFQSGPWAKSTGTANYVLTLRPGRDLNSQHWSPTVREQHPTLEGRWDARYLRGPDPFDLGVTQNVRGSAVVRSPGEWGGIVGWTGSAALPYERTRTLPYALVREDSDISVDSQPYDAIYPVAQVAGQGLVHQRLAATPAGTWRLVRMVVSDCFGPTEPLIVGVFNANPDAGAATRLGQGRIWPEDLRDPVRSRVLGPVDTSTGVTGNWYQVTVELDEPVTFPAGVTRWISALDENGEADPLATDKWAILGLQTTDPALDELTWDGPTNGDLNRLTVGTTPVTTVDMQWQLIPAAPPVTNLAVWGDVPQTNLFGPEAGCDGEPATLEYVRITWDGTSDPDFDRYQIERHDPRFDRWDLIAEIHSGLTVLFDDHEALPGFVNRYRVRQVNIFGGWGDWSNEAQVTVGEVACGVAFTSNERPDLNCVYADTTSTIGSTRVPDGEWQDLNRREWVELYGADYQVGVGQIQERGIARSWSLLVKHLPVPRPQGYRRFDRLRELAHTDLPYVCVRERTDRWYMQIDVVDGATRKDHVASDRELVAIVRVDGRERFAVPPALQREDT